MENFDDFTIFYIYIQFDIYETGFFMENFDDFAIFCIQFAIMY
jgi:hypothetical protein